MDHKPPKIGVVGLGRIGLALACRLRKLGIPVVGFNRTPERGRPLVEAGGALVRSPAAVARACHVLFTAVRGPREVEAVLLGPRGVREGGREGLIVVDLSTIDAVSSCRVAAALKQSGLDMLDAPLSGSVQAVEQGTLGLLVGGESSVLERARPALELIAQHIYHFGPSGAGCTAKLALNLLVGAMIQALSEALALLGAVGLSRQLFLEAVSTSGLASPLFQRAGQRAMLEDFAARFSLGNLHKDLALLMQESRRLGADLRLAQVLERLVGAEVPNAGHLDYSSLIAAEERRLRSSLVKSPLNIPGGRSVLES